MDPFRLIYKHENPFIIASTRQSQCLYVFLLHFTQCKIPPKPKIKNTMHYLWEIDIKRERKKVPILSRTRSQVSICNNLLQYISCFQFSISPILAYWLAEAPRREGNVISATVEKNRNRKKSTFTEINSFRFVCFCLSVDFWLAMLSWLHRFISMRKCFFYIASQKERNMIYCSQKCDNRNSCIDYSDSNRNEISTLAKKNLHSSNGYFNIAIDSIYSFIS